MHEPDHIEFTERVERPIVPSAAVKVGIVLGSALLFVVGAIAVMGASPSPSTGTPPSASTAPDETRDIGPRGLLGLGFGFGRGGFGVERGGVTITAINGSNLSLETDDGWTRTIAVTSETTITRAGTTIALADLKVGDDIAFRQDLEDDGSYTITAIALILPSTTGQVTAIDGSTITVTQRDGTSATIHVDADTTYSVDGADDATLADLEVGDVIVANGTERTDGSLDAEAIRAGFGRGGWRGDRHGLPGFPGEPRDKAPEASPSPSSTPS